MRITAAISVVKAVFIGMSAAVSELKLDQRGGFAELESLGLDNAANIIIELSETEEPFIEEIAACSPLFPISALRRLGWILENFTETSELDILAKLSKESTVKVSKLTSYKAYSDHIDNRWSIDLNERIEPDV